VKIISGQSHGVDSVKELAYTPVWILDVEIKPGGKITQNLPEGWNAFAYTLSGSTAFGVGEEKTTVGQFHNVVFEQKGDEVHAEVAEDAGENGHFSKSCFLSFPLWFFDFCDTPRKKDFGRRQHLKLDTPRSKNNAKKEFLYCVRRESNPGPIDVLVYFYSQWQRWILPLNHKRLASQIC
jgi:hypothetical protein